MHAANTGKELARILERLKAKKLILIDTAGMGARDVRLTEQLAALKLGAARAKVLLALPAQGEGHALDEIVRAFARINPAGCIITKVDDKYIYVANDSCADYWLLVTASVDPSTCAACSK